MQEKSDIIAGVAFTVAVLQVFIFSLLGVQIKVVMRALHA